MAISGGVDSMAMAFLASELQRAEPAKFKFIAFVIDHQARADSSLEAQKTMQILGQLGIESFLKSMSPDFAASHPTGFETAGRTERYKLLGKLAVAHRPAALLTAHHADDQAETIMHRLLSGYTGTGLRGIQEVSPVPENAGVISVHNTLTLPQSNRTWRGDYGMYVANPGLPLLRPMLDFTKAELQDTCRINHVSWSQDQTNFDPTLTSRNAIRSVLAESKLPQFLRTRSLLELGFHINMRMQENEGHTLKILNEKGAITSMDHFAGVCTFDVDKLHPGLDGRWMDSPRGEQYALAEAIRLIVKSVSPLSDVTIEQAINIIEHLWDTRQGAHSASKVMFERDAAHPLSRTHWKAFRAPLDHRDKGHVNMSLPAPAATQGQWSRFRLFDGRWWMSFGVGQPANGLRLRTLHETDFNRVPSEAGTEKFTDRAFDLLALHAPGKIRYTLPVVVDEKDRLLGFPTLNTWSPVAIEKGLECHCSYKHTGFPSNVRLIGLERKQHREPRRVEKRGQARSLKERSPSWRSDLR